MDPFNACRANVPSVVQRSILLIIFEEHVLGSEGDGWHLSLHQMTLGAWSTVVINRDCRYLCKDSESASASLSIFLVSFKSQSSSCRMIRARILASCVNMPKRKGALSPFEGSFFNYCQIESLFPSLCPVMRMVSRPELVQLFLTSLAAVSHRGSSCTVASIIF